MLCRNSFIGKLLSLFLLVLPLSAFPQSGVFWGAVAEGMNKAQESKQRERVLELERQHLELLQRQQEMEFERQRKATEGENRRIEAERQAKLEAERQENQRQLDAYNTGTMGTGFFVSKSGHIVTNAHVIGDYQYVITKDADGNFYQLNILAIDKRNDLALLQAAKKTDGLPIAVGSEISKGLKVFAVGYPQTQIQGTESKITDGVISSMSGLRDDLGSYQITNPIQAGNSGGPLVSETGAVVGVVVATVNARKFLAITGDIPQNINFAIKADMLNLFLTTNGIKPNRKLLKSSNPLGHVDRNTVLLAARPTPFGIASTPPPQSTIINSTKQNIDSTVEKTPPLVTDKTQPNNTISNSENSSFSEAQSSKTRCQVGNAPPIFTSREKCKIVNGKEVI